MGCKQFSSNRVDPVENSNSDEQQSRLSDSNENYPLRKERIPSPILQPNDQQYSSDGRPISESAKRMLFILETRLKSASSILSEPDCHRQPSLSESDEF